MAFDNMFMLVKLWILKVLNNMATVKFLRQIQGTEQSRAGYNITLLYETHKIAKIEEKSLLNKKIAQTGFNHSKILKHADKMNSHFLLIQVTNSLC